MIEEEIWIDACVIVELPPPQNPENTESPDGQNPELPEGPESDPWAA